MKGSTSAFEVGLKRLDREAQAPDWKTSIDRLAKLPPVEYDRCREAEAESVGCRVSTLDAEVRKARGDEAADGQGRPLEFPAVDPWPGPVDGAALLEELTAVLKRYAILPEHGAEACALWAVMTWMVADLDCLPLLRVLSPTRGCGKSTVLEVMAELVHRPVPASGISSAALFRLIELHGPTMLMDEVDTYLKESEDHRQILNAGHTRAAAVVIRTVGDEHEPRAFCVFGPKLLAGIGSLPGTIEDRAVRIELRKKAPGEAIRSLRRDGRDQFVNLRRRVCRWTSDNRVAIGHGAAHAVLPDGLPDRAADNWSPLVAIADVAGLEWGARARRAAVALTVTDDTAERKVMLLSDLRDLFAARGADRLPTAAIVEYLAGLEERPWGDCNKGKAIAARQLSAWLAEFKVKSRSLREGRGTFKGYLLADLEDPFARYLTSAQPSQRNNVDGARLLTVSHPSHTTPAVTDRNGLRGSSMLDCYAVTDEYPGRAGGEGAPAPVPGSTDAYCDEWDREEADRLARLS